ncbi:MAG: sigma-54-dependent Fis family transcriptional regulator [Leptonema illini]|uniref:Sigma-54-dependent Fis family transcriptional regulator n=1 Tax=Leptonema illini TaxID=183 RepID=A0A833H274_9LEPT|nr:MAG: sigma-54-dependent Fis family transcriptional regulator [Leptonema illini]
MKRRLRNWMERLILGPDRLIEDDLQQLLQAMQVIGHAYEDPESFLRRVLELLRRRFDFEKGGIVLTEANHPPIIVGDLTELPGEGRTLTTRYRLPGERYRALKDLFEQMSKGGGPAFADPAIDLWHRLLADLRGEGFVFFFPVFFQRELFAYLFLGPKRGRRSYTDADRFFLEFGSVAFALAVRNAGIRIENSRLRLAGLSEVTTDQASSDADSHRNESAEADRSIRTEIPLENRLLVFSDDRMRETVERSARIAGPDLPVLIVGETGTGKELLARWIHLHSRSNGPFVPVNCASIPASLWESELFGYAKGAFTDAKENRPGLVDIAAGGTLFFDEIGEMPLEIQPKILRLLQEKNFIPVGARKERPALCRMVFATHRDLSRLVREGRFRQDLYYRICVFEQRLLPLRERPADIPVLFEHFLHRYAEEWQLEPARPQPELLERMRRYDWPGNVRELENLSARIALEYPGRAVAASVLMSDGTGSVGVGMEDDLQAERDAQESLGLASGVTLDFEGMMNAYAKRLLAEAIQRSRGNRSRAAEMLGISRGRLNYQIRQLGLNDEMFD